MTATGKFLVESLEKNLLSNRGSTFYGIVQDSKERNTLMQQAGVTEAN